MTYIQGFTFILTVFCEKTRMLWLFPTESKRAPVYIIHLILTTFNNEQHTCKRVRVNNYGYLVNSKDVTNLIVEYFIIYMKTTGGDYS